MCGITGFFSPERPIVAETVRRATAVLQHRGPDGQRQWLAPSGRAGLGHARLSIIDVQGGDQPLSDEAGRTWAVVNGEFYDFERIRSELTARGHCFRTGSDSEILLHLYEEYGVQCLHQLRGEFALILWDERRQRLFVARDRFGIKPLFYAEIDGTLAFASEAKALFAAGLPARWDRETLGQLVSIATCSADRSPFEGVHQVPPGHYLLVSARERKLVRYWDFDYPAEPDGLANAPPEEAQIEQFGAVLEQAVRLRLRADVPVGCYLSGGLDSCAILGIAARHARQPIRAFNLAFDREEYDESPIAREMAARCNAELVTIPISQADLAEALPDAIWHAEQTFVNSHAVAKYLLSRAVHAQGYRVVLTGEGSDEILAGYPHFRRDLLLSEAAAQDPSALRARLRELDSRNTVSRGVLLPDGDTLPLDSLRRMLGFAPTWLETLASNGLKASALLGADHAAQQEGRDVFLDLLEGLDLRGQLRGRAALHQSLYLWSKILLPNYILSVLGDRMEMANSVEGRLPFLDHHVVELARSLPVSAKIRGTTEKYVLREAARPVLTETVYLRQKHPFLAPPATAAPEGALHELMQSMLRGRALERVPFYDRTAVAKLLDSLPQRSPAEQAALDPLLMHILTATLLASRFGLS